jgi:ABC-2 type transport system ATP-binding protein
LQEVEAVCSQVLIINEGRIAAQGTPEEIAGTMKGGDTWELLLKGSAVHELQTRLAKLSQSAGRELSSLTVQVQEDGTVKAAFFLGDTGAAEDKAAGEYIFDWAVAEGLKILSMNRKKISLEDIFVKLTTDEVSGQQLSTDEAGQQS